MAQVNGLDKSSELAETIKTLSINTDPPKIAMRTSRNPVDSAVADSWEDEEGDEVGDIHSPNSSAFTPSLSRSGTSDMPNAPPPTPASPCVSKSQPLYPRPSTTAPDIRARSDSPSKDVVDKRPEKSTAVANRLIAGALGVRAPKRTEEQRKYDRAIKEQEIRRKNKEKEDLKRKQEEAEKAKASIWDD